MLKRLIGFFSSKKKRLGKQNDYVGPGAPVLPTNPTPQQYAEYKKAWAAEQAAKSKKKI